MDLERQAERLRAERADMLASLAEAEATLISSAQDSDASRVDQHPGDAASDTEARELEVGKRTLLEARLALFDRALARIDAGTYGRCVVCNREIPEGRLEVLPETPYCLEHAQTNRRGGHGGKPQPVDGPASDRRATGIR